jgi:hypothetical protein
MASRSRARPAARLANQPLEIEAAISGPEQGNLDGVRRESLIVAAPGDLAEKIDVAEGGCQLEVETLTQCSGRPLERESPGGAAQIWRNAAQCCSKRLEVRIGTLVDDIDVLCESARAVNRCGHASDDDEVDARTAESGEQTRDVGHSRFRKARPAARASSAKR